MSQTRIIDSRWGREIFNIGSEETRVLHIILRRVDTLQIAQGDLSSTQNNALVLLQNRTLPVESSIHSELDDNLNNFSTIMSRNVTPVNDISGFPDYVRLNNNMVSDTTGELFTTEEITRIHNQFVSNVRDPFVGRFNEPSDLLSELATIQPMLDRVTVRANILRNLTVENQTWTWLDLVNYFSPFSRVNAENINLNEGLIIDFLYPVVNTVRAVRLSYIDMTYLQTILSDFFFSFGQNIFTQLDRMYVEAPTIISFFILVYFYRILLLICPKSLWNLKWADLCNYLNLVFGMVRLRFSRLLNPIIFDRILTRTNNVNNYARGVYSRSVDTLTRNLSRLIQYLPTSNWSRFFYSAIGTAGFLGITSFLIYNRYGQEIVIYFARAIGSRLTRGVQDITASNENLPLVTRPENLSFKSFVKELKILFKRYYDDFFH
jgi:hypothetical protein